MGCVWVRGAFCCTRTTQTQFKHDAFEEVDEDVKDLVAGAEETLAEVDLEGGSEVPMAERVLEEETEVEAVEEEVMDFVGGMVVAWAERVWAGEGGQEAAVGGVGGVEGGAGGQGRGAAAVVESASG